MFTPVSFAYFNKETRDIFSSTIHAQFNWHVFYFQFNSKNKNIQEFNNLIPELYDLGKKEIIIVDFLNNENNDKYNNYLYSSWFEHKPAKMHDKIAREYLRILGAKIINEEQFFTSEKLFFDSFINSIQGFSEMNYSQEVPQIFIVNTKKQFIINLKFLESLDAQNIHSGFKLLFKEIHESENEHTFYDIKKYFNVDPKSKIKTNNVNFSLESIYEDYIDKLKLVQELKDDKEAKKSEYNFRYTNKFLKTLEKLHKDTRSLILSKIELFIKAKDKSKFHLEKIKLNKNLIINRFYADDKFRIHFKEEVNNPLFCNAGPHCLYEDGYKVD